MTEANRNTLKFVATRYTAIIGLFLVQVIMSKVTHTTWFLGNFIFDNPIVISTILWIVLADLLGTCEAWFEQLLRSQVAVVLPVNEHIPFTIIRVIVWFFIYKYVGDFWPCVALVFTFPFVHDGQYYKTRNKLDPSVYPNGWFDYSVTSTSFIDKLYSGFGRTFAVMVRVAFFVAALGYICYFYLNK